MYTQSLDVDNLPQAPHLLFLLCGAIGRISSAVTLCNRRRSGALAPAAYRTSRTVPLLRSGGQAAAQFAQFCRWDKSAVRVFQDLRSRDRRRAFRSARRFGDISRRSNIATPMRKATQTTSGGVSAARSVHIAGSSPQPAPDDAPAGLVSSRAQRRCSFFPVR